ncbi:MAG: hypothetical protein H0T92_03960 [Pyrinomonadaceae bacterium]|nr:hypothetical protein [Pyrinomonadaceae bacterium]
MNNRLRKLPSLAQATAIICAVVATFGLFAGYLMLQKRNSVQFASPHRDVASAPALPQAQISEDEAMLRGTNAIIGGAVRNISTEKLQGLSIEIELMRRDGTATESRTLEVSPGDLAPGETGRYSLSLPTRQWIGARVTTLQSSVREAAVAFKSTPGARRPPERVPQGQPTVTKAPRTAPRGEEFINTPDNPTTIR